MESQGFISWARRCQGNPQGLHSWGMGVEKKPVKPRGQLALGPSCCCMETVVAGTSGGLPGLKPIGKLVAKPSEALSFLFTNNLLFPNRKLQHQHGKGARWDGEGWDNGGQAPSTTATAPSLFLPQKILSMNCQRAKQKNLQKESFG